MNVVSNGAYYVKGMKMLLFVSEYLCDVNRDSVTFWNGCVMEAKWQK